MEWFKKWRLERLLRALVEVDARLLSHEHIARHTGTYYPSTHADLSAKRALLTRKLAAIRGETK